MKKTLLIFSLFALSLGSFAQMSAVVYSEAGENFTLYLNGVAQNAKPATNVKIDNLTSEFYQARVDFEDKSLADFSNNNFACHKGMEVTYIIKKNKKGEYVLRFYTENAYTGGATATQNTPNNDAKNFAVADDQPVQTTNTNTNTNQGVQVNMSVPTDGSTTTTTTVNTRENPTNGNVGINMNINGNGTGAGINMNVSGTGVGTAAGTGNTTTNSTTTTTNPNNANVGMNINVDGMNIGLNMNVNDPMFQQSGTTTTTTTTTSSSSHSSTSSNNTHVDHGQTEPIHSKPVNNGPCAHSMDDASFAKAKATVESKGFDDTKLTQAKQITKANCLTSDQIKEMLGVFGFEETRLAYAKFAYDYCYDKNNYYTINDAFSFESTIEELNQFLETK